MAYKINAAAPKSGCVVFDDGGKLEFTYKPWAYTPDHEDVVAEAREGGKAGDFIKAWLLPILVTWDVVEEVVKRDKDGKAVMEKGKPVFEDVPVPLTHEGLGKVPFEILNSIVNYISTEMMPGEASSTSSKGSFS